MKISLDLIRHLMIVKYRRSKASVTSIIGWKTYGPALVQQEEKMQQVDREEDDVPDHHVKVASVEGGPANQEAASWHR